MLILMVILFAAPSLVKDSTARLINNDRDFEREAPFSFVLQEENPTVIQYDDYDLQVEVEGEVFPAEVFINVDNYQYRLTKESETLFTYRFNNLQRTTAFNLFAPGLRGQKVNSKDFEIDVLKKPNILGFDIRLDYPGYTGRKDETIQNVGDLSMPQGTRLSWSFNASNTNSVDLRFNNASETQAAERKGENLFSYQRRALKDETYMLYVSNEHLPFADSIGYALNVIPDLAPSISVEAFADSTQTTQQYFAGEASDDYGLKNLSFNYQKTNSRGQQQPPVSTSIKISGDRNIQYSYAFNLEELDLKPGDQISYFFEIFDNDAINGSKSARTQVMNYELPSIEELEEQEEQNSDEIKEQLKESLKESRRIQEEMKKLREKMLQQKEMDWQTKKELEKLLEQQKKLQEEINKAKEKFEENLQNQEQLSEKSEEILEKQEKLQELLRR
ncbi:MAG: hypothetical protein HKN16_06180 [Saprospiraceae bacterium]|nr:hypothetical protein [Saprospiraceae bacterium]